MLKYPTSPVITILILMRSLFADPTAPGGSPGREASPSLGQALTQIQNPDDRAELERLHREWRTARDAIASKGRLRRFGEGLMLGGTLGAGTAAAVAGVSTALRYIGATARPVPKAAVIAALVVGGAVGVVQGFTSMREGGRNQMQAALDSYTRRSATVLERASPAGAENVTRLHFESEARDARHVLESGGLDADDLRRTDRP